MTVKAMDERIWTGLKSNVRPKPSLTVSGLFGVDAGQPIDLMVRDPRLGKPLSKRVFPDYQGKYREFFRFHLT